MDNVKINTEEGMISVEMTMQRKRIGALELYHIPAFDLHFTANPDDNDLKERIDLIMTTFVSTYLDMGDWSKLVMVLHQKGFKAATNHNLFMRNVLKTKRPDKAKLNFSGEIQDRKGYETLKMNTQVKAAA